MTRTTQLRRYDLKPELIDEFLAWWPTRLVPAREAHGFRIDFAHLNREQAEFTWAVSVEGDADEFARIEAAYLPSPERTAAFDGVPAWTDAMHVALVERIA